MGGEGLILRRDECCCGGLVCARVGAPHNLLHLDARVLLRPLRFHLCFGLCFGKLFVKLCLSKWSHHHRLAAPDSIHRRNQNTEAITRLSTLTGTGSRLPSPGSQSNQGAVSGIQIQPENGWLVGRLVGWLVGLLVGEKFVELRGRGPHKDGASTP